MPSLRGSCRALLVVALVLAPNLVRAGEPDLRELEKTFKKIAADATPKTVCVKSYIEKTGDKAGFGSGAIISEDGYILTCAHVIDIAKRCEIVLANGKTYPAKLLGKNKKQDYALVKIEEKGLPFFETMDSDKLEIGQWVVALGHPGGPYEDVQPAFAAGRVTNLHQKLPVQFMDRFYDDGIQTDVPIFAGNSGGPLVTLEGKLVGLNGAIILINENAYAVPINEPLRDLDTMKKGELVKGKSPTQEDLAEFQKQMDPEMMNKLIERGMKNLGKLFGGKDGENPFGDLFGGKEGGGDLGKMLQRLFRPKGEKGEDGEEGEGLDLGKLMEQFQKMFGGGGGEEEGEEAPAPRPKRPAAPAPGVDRGGFLGLSASQEKKDSDGVVVDSVVAGSPAEKGGLKKGDVIVAIDGKLTPDMPALQAIVRSKAPGTKVKVTVDRAHVVDASVVRERVDVSVTIGAREGAK